MKLFSGYETLFKRGTGNLVIESNTANLEAIYIVLTKRERLNLPSQYHCCACSVV
jgi:hypothetical protein